MPQDSSLLVSVSGEPPARLDVDLLVVPVFEGTDPREVPGLDEAAGSEWSNALARGELTGKPFEWLLAPLGAGFAARRVLLLGAGPRQGFDADVARRLGGAAGTLGRQRRAGRLALTVPRHARQENTSGLVERTVQSFAEGLVIAQLDAGLHKSTGPEVPQLESAVISVDGSTDRRALDAAATRGLVLGESTNMARQLGNEPANVLTPSVFAERIASLPNAGRLAVEVLDEPRIAELGMGLLLGVARGSVEPPRVIVLRYEGTDADGPVLGLVGKGITFDTGGISIKPADGMEKMKVDMGGGAAVAAAMSALARLGAPVRAIGVIPSTENMPGGRAVKPGDVLRGASGKTVEVVNTDAEGRLILGDALWYAQTLGATHLVDIATLTGACVVALGRSTSGLFGRPDGWVDRVRDAAAAAGERAWPMPVFDDYFEQLKSEVADMSNTGGRPAGAITAALFLKQFAGDRPWAHLDIAGTVWNDDAKPWMGKGATGAGVRTLAELGLRFGQGYEP
jgi:leucyl aminopeptidase